jgi:hypothetical protein
MKLGALRALPPGPPAKKPRRKETKPRKPKPPPAGHARSSAEHKAGLTTIPAALEEACKTFETAVGGRGALVAHLAHGDLKARDDLLVGAIADPRNDVHSLARICMLYGLKFADLLQLFRGAGFVKAQLAAMQKVWTKLPDVAGDVMDRSVPHNIVCSTCAGEKTVHKKKYAGKELEEWDETCEDCAGRGFLQAQPRLDTQKVALQLGGLLNKEGVGVQVNVSQAQGQMAGMDQGFADFFRRSDRVLYPEMEEAEEPVEAEVVSEEEAEAS